MKVICNCQSQMKKVYKGEFGEEYYCSDCFVEVAVNLDNDEIKVTLDAKS